RPDGTDLTQLTFLSASDPDRFAPIGPWTADGSTLIVPGTIGGMNGIYAIATDGSGAITPLPTSPGAKRRLRGQRRQRVTGLSNGGKRGWGGYLLGVSNLCEKGCVRVESGSSSQACFHCSLTESEICREALRSC